MIRQEEVRWGKLDNTANLFPVIAGEGLSNVYRLSVTLKEEIDQRLLAEALDKVLPGFEIFNCRMRRGFFWYYFEENTGKPPKVVRESDYPCQYINAAANRNYQFRLTYYKRRINLEVFHSLTDGTGALNFLKEVIYKYLRLSHEELADTCSDRFSSSTSLNTEDSFIKNYRKDRFKKSYEQKKAFMLRGREFPRGMMSVVTGRMSVDEVKAAAGHYGATINEYLTANFLYSIYMEHLNQMPSKEPIAVSIPVNLRPYFGSVTSKNFFVMVTASFHPGSDRHSFEDVLSEVRSSLGRQLDREHLTDIISYNVTGERAMIIRAVPLAIKKIALRCIYSRAARANTATVTNLGQVEVDDRYRKYIEGFGVLLSKSRRQPVKLSIISYNGTLSASVTSSLRDGGIERAFFSGLTARNISVYLETNGVRCQ